MTISASETQRISLGTKRVPHSRRGPRPIAKPPLPGQTDPRTRFLKFANVAALGQLAAATLLRARRLHEASRVFHRLNLSGKTGQFVQFVLHVDIRLLEASLSDNASSQIWRLHLDRHVGRLEENGPVPLDKRGGRV